MSTTVNDQSLNGSANTTAPIDPRGNNIYEVAVVATTLNDLGEATGLALDGTFAESNGTADGIDTVKLRGNIKFASSLGQLSVDLNNPLFANIENVDISGLGNAKLNLIGNNENNVLTGNAADNFIEGGGGNDVLNGGAGNDSLDGGLGADALFGGVGDDTYVIDTLATGFDAAGKVVSATLQDTFTENNGTQDGIDTVRLRGELQFADSVGKVALDLSNPLLANIENLDVSETGKTKLDLIGNRENNLLIGNAADNYMTGGGGKNVLYGGAGNDTLDSGSAGSQDLLFGGAGDDTYIIDIELRKLTDANGNPVQNPSDDQIKLNDYFIEDDTAAGGNDTLKVKFAGDTAYDYESRLTIDLKDKLPGIENLDISGITGVNTVFILTGTDDNNQLIGRKDDQNGLFGGKGDDTIIGGDFGDRLYADDGNDYVRAGNGYDVLDGGDGDDYLFGGAGNDEIYGGYRQDYIEGGAGDDDINAREAIDRFGNKNELASAEEDTLIGGLGDDLYKIDLKITNPNAAGVVASYQVVDKVIEENGLAGGFDTIKFSLEGGGYDLVIDMNDKFANIEAVDAGGFSISTDVYQKWIVENGLDPDFAGFIYYQQNSRLKLLGGDDDNRITGSNYGDQLDGRGGNDTLNGGYGSDKIWGGDGDDALIADDYYLNAGDDTLFGGAGNDFLYNVRGSDLMFGGDGDDRFVNNYYTTPTMSGGAGADTFRWLLKEPAVFSYGVSIDDADIGVSNITDFSLAEGDKLDLRDCLIGEDGDDVTRLLDYLDVKVDAGNTIVTVSAFGILNNSKYTTEVAEDIHINLKGVDLFAATGSSSESQLLQNLMTTKNLIVDV